MTQEPPAYLGLTPVFEAKRKERKESHHKESFPPKV